MILKHEDWQADDRSNTILPDPQAMEAEVQSQGAVLSVEDMQKIVDANEKLVKELGDGED